MIKTIQFFLITLFLSSSVMAGTVIKIQNNNEDMSIMTDGQRVRMNMSGADYVIVDYKNKNVSVVDPQKQQVMLLNVDEVAKGNSAPLVQTSVKRLSSGQMIAGYKTQKYSYTANGKSCGVIYGSTDAYQAGDIKALLGAMKTMLEKQRAALGGFAAFVDDCTLADLQVVDHVNTIGMPMRTEKNGRVESEIKSINMNAVLPANTFVIPANYRNVTMQDETKAATKDIVNAQQQMQQRGYYGQQGQQPQVQQMARQMQQSGQVTPEMMEQMRRAQHMQQYRQH
jgi:hypothetical protein